MNKIKQIELGALYIDGIVQDPTIYQKAKDIPLYQPDTEITISEAPEGKPECTIKWNEVTLPNGQTLLIADRALLAGVSYDDLGAAGFVEGQEVTLGGKDYLCRLLHCDEVNRENDEWEMALDAVGADDKLWHWQKTGFWVVGTPTDQVASTRVYRGFFSSRLFFWISSDARAAFLGFRPVLVPLSNDDESMEISAILNANLLADTQGGEQE